MEIKIFGLAECFGLFFKGQYNAYLKEVGGRLLKSLQGNQKQQ